VLEKKNCQRDISLLEIQGTYKQFFLFLKGGACE